MKTLSDTHAPVLAFKPHLHATVLGDDEVLLIAEASEGTILHGRAYATLAPLIDGTRTADDIVSAAPDLSPALAYYALTLLEKNGHVGPAPAPDISDVAPFWAGLGVDAEAAVDALRSATVAVIGDGNASNAVGALTASFEEMGARCVTETTADATLVVCAVDDYLSPSLPDLAQRLDGRAAWMPVKPGGEMMWYGPVFDSSGPCFSCLRLRIQENRYGRMLSKDVGAPPSPLDALKIASAASLAAIDAARWIVTDARADHPLANAMFTWDPKQLALRRHRIVPHHACPHCFPPSPRDPRAAAPIALSPTPGRFSVDGGARPITADAMLDKLEPYASPITGVLPALERVACDGLTSTYSVEGAFGKGVSDEQGRVSCWMEWIEMRNATFTGVERSFDARYADLGARAVHPAEILQISPRQYADRDALNRGLRPGIQIPLPIDDDLTLSWTAVWSLLRRETRYVPTALCYFGHPQEKYFGRTVTNGGAAGAAHADAILHAALELIERDAVAMWWYSRAPRRAIDLAALREPIVDDILRALTAKGDRVWAIDVTSDFALPVIVVVRCRADGRLGIGFGAGVYVSEAVVRALTELEQIDALSRNRPPEIVVRLDAHAWLEPSKGSARSMENGRPRSRRDVTEDLQRVVDRFEATGHDLLVLDTSRAGIDVVTVRAYAPGLRHWIPRFAPGRLYDVPVALGWIKQPLTEEQLNERPFWA